MIFVTVGGMRAFERLVRAMDRIAGGLGERVVMQIGSTDYEPKNCDYFRFMPRGEIEELYANARVVVCHAGSGSILTALEHNKPLVLVPRLRQYGEVFDDHQLELARECQNRGTAVVYDIDEIESALSTAIPNTMELKGRQSLIGRLKEYLDRIDNESKGDS